MGIFNPFISSCEHERNLDWILKRVKGMPQKEEMESALEEARDIVKRTDGLVEQVEYVIEDATAAAKAEIKNDLSESIGRIEEAERNTIAKATEVRTAIDNATYNAKLELSNYVNEQLTEIRTLAESVSDDAGYVEQVVSNAKTALQNQLGQEIYGMFNELEELFHSEITEKVETAKNTIFSANSDNFAELSANLFQDYADELEDAKQDLETVVSNGYNEKVAELESHADEYIPHAVASAVAQRFVTCGVFIPVSAWSNKTARVNTGMDVDKTTLFVTYSPSSFNDWFDNGVRCTLSEGTYLEFECATVPAAELYVYVVAVENMVVED